MRESKGKIGGMRSADFSILAHNLSGMQRGMF